MKNIILTTKEYVPLAERIMSQLPQTIRHTLPKEIAIIAVSPQESLALNRRYRNKRKPANVLSFLYGAAYGEIIICPAVIKKEAKKQGNTQAFQMTWMVLHGMLHLAGLHHELSQAVQKRTIEIENAVLNRLTA